MNGRKEILSQINTFKNFIIQGKKEKEKKNDNKTIQSKVDSNQLVFMSNQDSRNTTAPNDSNKKQKRYNKHLKITAKNKDNIKNINSTNMKINNQNQNIDLEKIAKKILGKSYPKNIKVNSNNNNNKKETSKNTNLKRINSSNNILIVNNNNVIDYFTQKILEGNHKGKNKGSLDNKIKNNKFSEFTQNNSKQNSIMGLFNITLHSNYNNFDEYKTNINNFKNKNAIRNSLNNTSDLTNATKTAMQPNNNKFYSIKRSSSIDIHKNMTKQLNKRENQKDIMVYDQILSMKDINNIKIENEKGGLDKIHRTKSKNNVNKMNKGKNEEQNNLKRKNYNLYQYLILKGNASYLVKNCMYHRVNWIESEDSIPDSVDNPTNTFNFKWKELSYGIDYYNLNKNPKMKQIVNHFEFHYSISNKANMFMNLMKYCEKRNLPIFKYVPFTIVFKIKERRKIKNNAKKKKWNKKLEKLKNFIQNIDKNVKNYNDIGKYYLNEEYIKDREKRIEFEITKQSKKALNKKQSKEEEKEKDIEKNIEEEKYVGKFEVYSDIFPRLKMNDKVKKSKSNEEEVKKINKIVGSNTVIEIPDTHYQGRNMWVIKAVNLNRGMCIKVVNSFEQMEAVINKFKNGVDYSNFTIEKIDEEEKQQEQEPQDLAKEENISKENIIKVEEDKNTEQKIKNDEKTKNNNENKKDEKEKENDKEEKLYNCNKILIQKYIENPLLYKGRKCDMRIWVLLTHQMKVFLFKEGHLKACSVQYDINSKDAFTHITNYSFQKHNNNFQKFEKGNEVPFYDFQKFIDEQYPEKNYKLKKDLMKQIKEIISHSMRCVKKIINRNNRNFQFEIFGYDFMLDKDFNVFLIEINTNPGLEISSPWIQIIIPRMLDDAFRLTVDKVFEPIYDFSKSYKGDYTEEQKKLLIDSKIPYDFNAVNPNPESYRKNSISIQSSTISNSNLNENKNVKSKSNSTTSNILNINLELDEFDQNLIKGQIVDKNKNDKKDEEKDEEKNEKNNVEVIDNKNIENEKIINNEEKKRNKGYKSPIPNKKNKTKYISPFPVPGYSLDENLWDFICDLNEKDPYEIEKEKEKEKLKEKGSKDSFTGIRHLLKKRKKKNKKEKNEEKNKNSNGK